MADSEEPLRLDASRFAEPEEDSWLDFVQEQEQRQAERVEDAAKFLAGMISIAFAIFLKTDEEAFNGATNPWLVKVAAGLWLLSLGASFFVLFPQKYRYSKASATSIQFMNQRVVQRKRGWLLGAMGLFVVALGLLAVEYFV